MAPAENRSMAELLSAAAPQRILHDDPQKILKL